MCACVSTDVMFGTKVNVAMRPLGRLVLALGKMHWDGVFSSSSVLGCLWGIYICEAFSHSPGWWCSLPRGLEYLSLEVALLLVCMYVCINVSRNDYPTLA